MSEDWWKEINQSQKWRDGFFLFLCGAYGVISIAALVQLIRIQIRVPNYGWTTQKVFHVMNFIFNGARSIVFGLYIPVFLLKPMVLTIVILDFPAAIFFSTCTLLVLFWAEIYHQVNYLETDKLRIYYISINVGVYFIQFCFWIYIWQNDNAAVVFAGKIFISAVSFLAAVGFAVYGGKMFFMLKSFHVESKGRGKKLREVGSITAICFTCFFAKSIVECVGAVVDGASLKTLDYPVLNLIYYTLTELIPSAFILLILSKLPPKRVSAQYQLIR
ncbi:Tobamovirus multiplication protein 1 [Zostera marina]|uniref:Tobamovirus multiplication protein 1 n=1 Tax=Zostera marina TaxID=29655 RepID=A0A0K9NML4_ZOSMR|nr:Tobamovirus multiplication protein 1 [Zostera marina]